MAENTVPKLQFDTTSLPLAQLESLKFKANQIIESIQALQRTLESGYQPVMPAWPDILSKYNVILSQTHSFSSSLVSTLQPGSRNEFSSAPAENLFEKIALHPNMHMLDSQLDSEVIPLLRNQQTTEVLGIENDTVRRLSEHMATRGSVGVLANLSQYPDVLAECTEIRGAHDRRVERAVRAVMMLKEKFDWKQRVMVEVEEPEELNWDPRVGLPPSVDEEDEDDEDEDDEDGSDEDEIEENLAPNGTIVAQVNGIGI